MYPVVLLDVNLQADLKTLSFWGWLVCLFVSFKFFLIFFFTCSGKNEVVFRAILNLFDFLA